MSKVTMNELVKGAHIWMDGWDDKLKVNVPLELIVVTGELVEGIRIYVIYAHYTDLPIIGPSYGISDNEPDFWIYPADKGIRPINYDSRPTQLFTTKEEMQAAIDLWIEAGKNPNFLVGN